MAITVQREKSNPIVTGGAGIRRAGTFNPGVIFDNGKFYMLDRAYDSIRPFICKFGLLSSEDGVKFAPVLDREVFSAQQLGFSEGTVEDPRIVKIEGEYYITFAFRPHTFNCFPNGVNVPDYTPLKEDDGKGINNTLSGFARSKDLKTFEFLGFINSSNETDDRDVILFDRKIDGNFVVLRRPMNFVGEEYGCSGPSVWICYSKDLKTFTSPKLLLSARYDWEGGKVGAGAPPVLTDEGFLLLYHGVDKKDVYKVGAVLLDRNNPEIVLKRTERPFLQPEEYYERFGLVIPNVVFPTAAILKGKKLMIYYGCCDTCIALATVDIDELLGEMV